MTKKGHKTVTLGTGMPVQLTKDLFGEGLAEASSQLGLFRLCPSRTWIISKWDLFPKHGWLLGQTN